MRGQKIFNQIIKDSGITKEHRKGRNNSLVDKRNECLVARYYYYAAIKNKCFEDILRQMVSEFFLSPTTISMIVRGGSDQLQSLKQKAPVIYYFQNNWPHMKW